MFVKDIIDDGVSQGLVTQLSSLELVKEQSTVHQVSVYWRHPCVLILYGTYFRGFRTRLRQNLHRNP